MFMYAIIWFYIIIMTTFWRSFLIRWIGTKTIKNQWCDALTWDLGGLHLFKQLAVSCWITWFISSFRSNRCQTWANSWQLFSLKMVKSCHFEWKQLSFFKFARLWQHLKFVFSKKATKLDEIFTVNLTLTT